MTPPRLWRHYRPLVEEVGTPGTFLPSLTFALLWLIPPGSCAVEASLPLPACRSVGVQHLRAGSLQVPVTRLQQLQALRPAPQTQTEQLLHLQKRRLHTFSVCSKLNVSCFFSFFLNPQLPKEQTSAPQAPPNKCSRRLLKTSAVVAFIFTSL